MTFDLKDIVPKTSKFTVSPNGKKAEAMTLTLRPITLRDQDWLNSKWEAEELQKVICDIGSPEFVEIVYHQLDLESKEKVLAIEVQEDKDERGKPIVLDLSGPEKLRYTVSSHVDISSMFEALMKARGLSLPLLEKIAEAEAKDKKKLTK